MRAEQQYPDGPITIHYRFYVECLLDSLYPLPLGVIGRLCSVIVATAGHLLYYFY